MLGKFEKSILLAASASVLSLVALAAFDPPKPDTERPRAILDGNQKARPVEASAGLAGTLSFQRSGATGDPVEKILGARGSDQLSKTSQLQSHTAENLNDTFDQLGYDLQAVTKEGVGVPRIFLATLPSDMAKVGQAEKRKAIFVRSILPLVLQINEEISADRERLWRLHVKVRSGQVVSAVDRLWLLVLSERYKMKGGDIAELLMRVDIVPPSLALAQSAEESGWGTSRFSRQGNAIFGEWTFNSAEGLIPAEREVGKTHSVKVFKTLLDSVRAYARNLNSHRAYREFRAKRHVLRSQGALIRGKNLVDTLRRYSERGVGYVKTLRSIIIINKLDRLDGAKLIASAQTNFARSAI
ncbi:MAG: hypothetical protein CBB68_08595 [Rhodospirillaceae bacterium TMED8]|nr:hypothetical protein [Magnetovibrio sp.]OUT50427.1 MAG: hypothetical protein CBB68_08595 [Rhodospirillaceae bacterium TMED8]